MVSKHLISILDLATEDILEIFEKTAYLKTELKNGNVVKTLKDKTLGMIFQKSSTRTRVSFEVGMYQLGGTALFLNTNDMQLGRGETIKDTSLTLSRYLDGIMIRTFEQQDVIDLAQYGSIPVINGLTNLEHPCQALGDIYTILEHLGDVNKPVESSKDLMLVYIGDGNNVANSLVALCAKLGMNITVCSPNGYEPDKAILDSARKIASDTGSQILVKNELDDELIEQADATQPPATRQYGLFKFGFYVKDIGGFFNYLKTWQVDTDDTVFYDEALDAKSFGFIDLYGNRLQVFQRCDTFDC